MLTTTATDLEVLLHDVDRAAVALATARSVPVEVRALVDRFGETIRVDAPLSLAGDPYLTTMLFAAAFRSERALRRRDAEERRRELRIALEQFRHALRDLLSSRPFDADAPVRDVLARTVEAVSAPQRDLAGLLGVSTRQLQRWLSSDGPSPAGDDEARIRVLGQIVNQLRHVFTGPGVLAWFHRRHPVMGARPADWLQDPLRYPELIAAAAGSRAMTG